VLEKSHIVDCGFDAQHKSELIVELERDWPHGVLDARALDAGIQAIPHLAFELRHELLAQEGGNVIRLDGVNGSAAEVLIQRLEIGLLAEHDVGRIFALVYTPVIVRTETAMNGTEAAGELVQLAMQLLDAQIVGERLRPLPVGDTGGCVVQQSKIDAAPAQRIGQPVVPVEVDLQTAR
jgi:hypothetical protein